MRSFLFFALFIGLIALVDYYALQALRTAFPEVRWLKKAYTWTHFALYGGFIAFFVAYRSGLVMPRSAAYLFSSLLFALFLPKLIIAIILLAEDGTRLVRWAWMKLSGPQSPIDPNGTNISRAQFLSKSALALASIPFGAMVYGIVKGKYDYTVRKVQLAIKDLPAAFEGFTITQISDIHTGSFDNKEAVQRGINLVNAQQSDAIFFTGDLVNNHIDEVQGFEDIYSQLTAKEGVFSVLGNHDYGDYLPWDSPAEKAAHFQKVLDKHGELGWNLLKNQNHLVKRGEDELAIIGVENWGAKARFPKYGRMAEAVQGTENARVKLLLSHDPSHWDAQVRPEYPDINAMFSGHTHGMQFGVEIPGFKWSPVQYVYKQWAGLYEKGEQYLYVNRGFGFIGFSGRVGIYPEITVFELTKA
ncbi:MAG: metallophosphoesterase [Bacteroidota bacterium]